MSCQMAAAVRPNAAVRISLSSVYLVGFVDMRVVEVDFNRCLSTRGMGGYEPG